MPFRWNLQKWIMHSVLLTEVQFWHVRLYKVISMAFSHCKIWSNFLHTKSFYSNTELTIFFHEPLDLSFFMRLCYRLLTVYRHFYIDASRILSVRNNLWLTEPNGTIKICALMNNSINYLFEINKSWSPFVFILSCKNPFEF